MGLDQVIRFNDPDGEHRITEAEAIERQRALGRLHDYEYESDEAALSDFMIIHCAWKENGPFWPKGKGGWGYSL